MKAVFTMLLAAILAVGVIFWMEYMGESEVSSLLHKYQDSAALYRERFLCAEQCGKPDSTKIYWPLFIRYADSADKYYALKYPPISKSMQNCNCK